MEFLKDWKLEREKMTEGENKTGLAVFAMPILKTIIFRQK